MNGWWRLWVVLSVIWTIVVALSCTYSSRYSFHFERDPGGPAFEQIEPEWAASLPELEYFYNKKLKAVEADCLTKLVEDPENFISDPLFAAGLSTVNFSCSISISRLRNLILIVGAVPLLLILIAQIVAWVRRGFQDVTSSS